MGLFSKLFGQKNQDGKAQSVTDKSFADKQPDVKTYENVVHQIVVSEFLQTNLKLKLKQAFEDHNHFMMKMMSSYCPTVALLFQMMPH